jgi:hypothetical protein
MVDTRQPLCNVARCEEHFALRYNVVRLAPLQIGTVKAGF